MLAAVSGWLSLRMLKHRNISWQTDRGATRDGKVSRFRVAGAIINVSVASIADLAIGLVPPWAYS